MSEISGIDWSHLFPLAEPRDSQIEAINFALTKAIDENKRYIILECGTGTGKSAIGLTIARYLNSVGVANNFTAGSYFLTTQKVLQDQYVKDFSKTMKSLKSSTNYACNFHKKKSCNESMKMLKAEPSDSRFFKSCSFNCVYKKAKEDFLSSQESITNFSYFITEAAYSGKIVPRKVLVVDESHNIETELSKFIEITVSENFAERILKLEIPPLETQYQVVKWISDVYIQKLTEHLAHIDSALSKYKIDKEKLIEFVSLSKQIEMLKSHLGKIQTFLNVYDSENWIMNIVESEIKGSRKFEFKVIDVSPFAENYLFRLGEKVIMMSATIINKNSFCEQLGIPADQAAFISLPSPFPVENRPILYSPVGKMGMESIDKTLPNLVKAIKAILDAHPDEKGIIHAHTYKIAAYIKKNVRSDRLLMHDNQNREETLRRHIKEKKPSVLLSPSMTEGVDLKDDSSRFQIICKIPYPYLGDKLCRKRMNKWKWWYSTQTAKTILQSVGRSIRNMDDHAVTYILDADWETFYSRNRDIFPEDFKLAINAL